MIVKSRYHLPKKFAEELRARPVNWGFGVLSEAVFVRTYSRGGEKWADTIIRVVEGVMSIRKDHLTQVVGVRWNDDDWHPTATALADAIFDMRMLPPGRGLWALGTDFVYERGSAALNNCGYRSVEDSLSDAAAWVTDHLMLGVGVGWDTHRATFRYGLPFGETVTIEIPDTREGWVESVRQLIASYENESNPVEFDYSLIRSAGAPIKGFGGISAGYEPLEKLHKRIRIFFENALAEDRSRNPFHRTRLIADVMNAIGACVVAGNVRRCLPQGTVIHLERGGVPIEDVEIGDIVVTTKGKGKVSAVFDQGLQNTVLIEHQHGTFECTANHRVAVFSSLQDWTFKRADELRLGDRLAWDPSGYDGEWTDLPNYESSEKRDKDTRSRSLKIPELTPEMAWFVGLFHGDGYSFVPHANAKTPNGYGSVACSPEYPLIIDRAVQVFRRFGLEPKVKDVRGERTIRVEVYATNFARYVRAWKVPKRPLVLPEWIRNGTRSIRAGYLAGLFDSDGSCETRPLAAVQMTDLPFLREVKKLYASLGISVKVSRTRGEQGVWEPMYSVDVIGPDSIREWETQVAPYSGKYTGPRPSRSRNGFTFPTEMVRARYRGDWITPNRQQTCDRISRNTGQNFMAYPLAVLGVSKGSIKHTFDIEVDDLHEFTAEGLVVHNSAEIALGNPSDPVFARLKDYSLYPEREEIGWMSNNSLVLESPSDFEMLPDIAPMIAENGEPGILNLINVQKYGRAGERLHDDAIGVNPCGEIGLESNELCCLCEIFPTRCENENLLMHTFALATFYASTVSLLRSHSPETNAVVARNHRIGVSVSGIADWIDSTSVAHVFGTLNRAYEEIVRPENARLAREAGVPPSIRVSTCKPSGTISLLAGVSPGVHWPLAGYVLRRMRVATDSEVADRLREAKIPNELDVVSDNTSVFEFPLRYGNGRTRPVSRVSVYEQAATVAMLQRCWADNAVSNTLTVQPHELHHIDRVLALFAPQTKSLSLLPDRKGVYAQMPLEQISKEEYSSRFEKLPKIRWDSMEQTGDGEAEKYCDGDSCQV